MSLPGPFDFHLPREVLIIPNRSRLLGQASSNMERRGADLRKLLPQAAKSPAHRRHQKDQLHSFSTAHSWEEEELSKNSLRRQTLPLNSKFEPKQKQ